MNPLNIFKGVVVGLAAMFCIMIAPQYTFVPLLETEYSLEWKKDTVPVGIEVGPGLMALEMRTLHEAYQIHDHWDLAGEVVLHWQFHAKDVKRMDGKTGISSYLVWKCQKKKPYEHYHMARVYGRMIVRIPGFETFRTLEGAKAAATFDYYNAVYGIDNPIKYEPEAKVHTM